MEKTASKAPPSGPGVVSRLDSWKAIAAHFNRDVSTVQRWEKGEQLPVHRHVHAQGASIYAFTPELDAWWRARRAELEGQPSPEPGNTAAVPHGTRGRNALLAMGVTVSVACALVLWIRSATLDVPQPIRAIAVLPFVKHSEEVPDYFVDGMTDALIAELGRAQPLRVISYQSVARYRNSRRPLREIARELGVDGIVEGSVLRARSRVRVIVRLVDARTDRQHWAGSFERDVQDVLAVHRDVAQSIVTEVSAATARVDGAASWRRTVHPDAYEAFLKGRHHSRSYSRDELEKALAQFEEAVAIDPTYAPAYAAMARTYGAASMLGYRPATEILPLRLRAANRAVELAEDLADGHVALAGATFYQAWDWPRAEAAFRRSLALNANNVDAHQIFSWYLAAMGRFDEARRHVEEARQLNPIAASTRLAVASVYWFARDYDQATEEARRAVALDGSSISHAYLGWALLLQGNRREGQAELQAAVNTDSKCAFCRSMLAYGHAVDGDRASARRELRRLLAGSGTYYVPAFQVAVVHAGLDETDRAMAWLQRAYAERADAMVWLKVDQRLDTLRTDPRFQDMLERMHFPR
jgi:eukaryotic-like serine/threonine-protein kinase